MLVKFFFSSSVSLSSMLRLNSTFSVAIFEQVIVLLMRLFPVVYFSLIFLIVVVSVELSFQCIIATFSVPFWMRSSLYVFIGVYAISGQTSLVSLHILSMYLLGRFSAAACSFIHLSSLFFSLLLLMFAAGLHFRLYLLVCFLMSRFYFCR